jgi:hypothetical protein
MSLSAGVESGAGLVASVKVVYEAERAILG